MKFINYRYFLMFLMCVIFASSALCVQPEQNRFRGQLNAVLAFISRPEVVGFMMFALPNHVVQPWLQSRLEQQVAACEKLEESKRSSCVQEASEIYSRHMRYALFPAHCVMMGVIWFCLDYLRERFF